MTEILFPVVVRKHPNGKCELVDLRRERAEAADLPAALCSARDYEWAIACLRAERHGGKPEDYVSWATDSGFHGG